MIDTYTIEKVSVREAKQSSKGDWFYPVGLKIKGKWYNGLVFKKTDLSNYEAGKKIQLKLYENTAKDGTVYDNWKLPSQTDRLEARIDILEQRMDKAARFFLKENQTENEHANNDRQRDEAHNPF